MRCRNLLTVVRNGRFYVWVGGNCSSNLGLEPKCDMKHCLTNSKRRHIDAKRSFLWSSKYAKMCFRQGLRCGALDAPSDPQVVWRGDTYTPPHSAPRLFHLRFRGVELSPPNIFLYNSPWLEMFWSLKKNKILSF